MQFTGPAASDRRSWPQGTAPYSHYLGCLHSHTHRCQLSSSNLDWGGKEGGQVGVHKLGLWEGSPVRLESGWEPPTKTGFLSSSTWAVGVRTAEQDWRQALPTSAALPVLEAWAALLLCPVSTVSLCITDQGWGQAVARAARPLPLPTSWDGTAWSGEGRQAQNADKEKSQRSPQSQKDQNTPAHKS